MATALTQCEGALDWHTCQLTEKEAFTRNGKEKSSIKTFGMLTIKWH